jgi:hypothetical protein
MFGQKQPECISWSRQTDIGDTEDMKHISHAGIDLWVGRPRFTKDETWSSLGVYNNSRKALGFGTVGIGLTLDLRPQNRNAYLQRL